MREGPYRLISERGCVQMRDEKGREDFADELVRGNIQINLYERMHADERVRGGKVQMSD